MRQFGRDMAEALYYLHSHKVICADLKPSNILINEFGMLKLCDFGLAKKLEDVGKANKKKTTGAPAYMAPELFTQEGCYSFASDLWSLGIVMYELATGKPPYRAEKLKELIKEISTIKIKKLKSFGVEFNDLIVKLLEKDPVQRISWE